MFIESVALPRLDGTLFSMPENANHDDHWRRNLQITAALLGIWFAVSFGVSFFARELSARWFGWPFGFWVAAQGAPLVYLLLVGLYAWRMHRLDRRLIADEEG